MTFYFTEIHEDGSMKKAEKISAKNLKGAKNIASKNKVFTNTVLVISSKISSEGYITEPICKKVGDRWQMCVIKESLENSAYFREKLARINAGEALDESFKKGLPIKHVTSDRSGILIGNKDFNILISNSRGEDGTTDVIIDEGKALDEKTLNKFYFHTVFSAKNSFLFGSDCSMDEPIYNLDGDYSIWSLWDVIIIRKK